MDVSGSPADTTLDAGVLADEAGGAAAVSEDDVFLDLDAVADNALHDESPDAVRRRPLESAPAQAAVAPPLVVAVPLSDLYSGHVVRRDPMANNLVPEVELVGDLGYFEVDGGEVPPSPPPEPVPEGRPQDKELYAPGVLESSAVLANIDDLLDDLELRWQTEETGGSGE